MTQDEKRIAIYEALGWYPEWSVDSVTGRLQITHWLTPEPESIKVISTPDIFNDSSACSEAEKAIQGCSNIVNYALWLVHLSKCRYHPSQVPTDIRAEALYQTLCNNQ